MSATLNQSTYNSNSLYIVSSNSLIYLLYQDTHWAFSSHQRLWRFLSMRLCENIAALNTRAHRHRAALILARTLVRLNPAHFLEIVCSNDQRAPSCTSADEVVSRIADNKPEVVVSCKVQTALDVVLVVGV